MRGNRDQGAAETGHAVKAEEAGDYCWRLVDGQAAERV